MKFILKLTYVKSLWFLYFAIIVFKTFMWIWKKDTINYLFNGFGLNFVDLNYRFSPWNWIKYKLLIDHSFSGLIGVFVSSQPVLNLFISASINPLNKLLNSGEILKIPLLLLTFKLKNMDWILTFQNFD